MCFVPYSDKPDTIYYWDLYSVVPHYNITFSLAPAKRKLFSGTRITKGWFISIKARIIIFKLILSLACNY